MTFAVCLVMESVGPSQKLKVAILHKQLIDTAIFVSCGTNLIFLLTCDTGINRTFVSPGYPCRNFTGYCTDDQ